MLYTVVFFVQNMSDTLTFRSIFKGKQNILEEKIDTEHGLLSKLEADKVITNRHRNAIEVTSIKCLHVFG